MPITTVPVSIVTHSIVGAPLPYAKVIFQLTAPDIDAGVVGTDALTVRLAADGTGSVSLWPNALGTQGTRYSVKVLNRDNQVQYDGFATVPNSSCNLHQILNLEAPASVDDAEAAAQAAQGYAAQTSADAQATAADRAAVATDREVVEEATAVAVAAAATPAVAGVYADLTNINTVAQHVATIDQLAPHVDATEALAPHTTQIDALASRTAGLDALSSRTAGLDALSSRTAKIDALAADQTNIDAVANDLANVDIVANDKANVDIVAGAKANVDTNAQNIGAINTNATNIAAILTAEANALSAQSAAALANGYLLMSTGLAAQAQAYAAAAASVAQQDLSGVTAQALHRSPNAIVAECDWNVSQDANPAWVDQVGHLPYVAQAVLNGTWLGSQTSELLARVAGGTVGPELLSNTAFDTATGVTGNAATVSASGGTLSVTNTGSNGSGYEAVTTIIGRTYRVRYTNLRGTDVVHAITKSDTTAMFGTNFVTLGNNTTGLELTNSPVFVATATTTYIHVGVSGSSTGKTTFLDDLSVKEVTAFADSGAYYNDAADGKHKRLWRNALANSAFTGGTAGTIGSGAVAPTNWAFNSGSGSITFPVSARPGAYLGQNNLRCTAVAQAPFLEGSGAANSFAVLAGQIWVASFYVEALNSGSATLATFTSMTVVGNTKTYRKNGIAALSTDTVASGDFIEIIHTASSSGTASFRYGLGISGAVTADITLSPVHLELVANATSVATAYENKAAGNGSNSETTVGNVAKPPRLGKVVVEATRVSIYDLLQPGRPMWRAFPIGSATGSSPVGFSTTALNSVSFESGKLLVGSGAGLWLLDFAKDDAWRFTVAGAFRYNGTLAQATSNLGHTQANSTQQLASSTVNALAACTMPDAPIDAITGLQVPTVLVATASGLSIIQNDGAVRPSSSTGNYVSVSINPYMLTAGASGATPTLFYALKPSALGASFALAQLTGGSAPGFTNSGVALNQAIVAGRGTVFARPTGGGVSVVRLNESNPAASLVGHISDFYSTGWVLGSAVRCLLSSTAAGSVSGANAVVNGDFSTDISGWTNNGDGTPTWNAGKLRMTSGSANNAFVYGTGIPVTPGAVFTLSGTVTNLDASARSVYVRPATATASTGPGTLVQIGGLTNTSLGAGLTTTLSSTWLVPQGVTTVYPVLINAVSAGSPGVIVDFDNITYTLAIGDYSVKGKPATINGTLTFTAVAGAAQMVAASGWSNSNYIQEPYSADLDGAVAWPVWFNTTGYGPGNGLSQPQDFSTASWTKTGIASVNTTATVAPDGTTTGNLLLEDSTTDFHQALQSTGGASGFTQHYYVFVKEYSGGSKRYAVLSSNTTNNGTNFIVVDCATGTITQSTFTTGGGPTITADANGWWRIGFSSPVTTGGVGVRVTVGLTNAPTGNVSSGGVNAVSYTGNGTGGVYFWGAVLGNGVTPNAYVPGKTAVWSGVAPFVERRAATGAYTYFGLNFSGGLTGEVYDGTNTRNVVTTSSYSTGTPTLGWLIYYPDGTLSIAVNDTPRVAVTRGAPLGALTNASAVLTIGNARTLDAALPSAAKLCLLRPATAAPSDEDIRRIYHDEKAMFAPGAQVTLPDSGTVVSIGYDDRLNRLLTASAANTAEFSGFVRVASAASAAGSVSRHNGSLGRRTITRTGTNPGMDYTAPAQNLKEELRRIGEAIARHRSMPAEVFDFTGGFTATTTNTGANQCALTSVASLTVPKEVNLRGAVIAGSGIQAGTKIVDVSGTTIYIDKPATAAASGVQINFASFPAPPGYDVRHLLVTGARQRDIASVWARGFDSTTEQAVPTAQPGNSAYVQLECLRRSV